VLDLDKVLRHCASFAFLESGRQAVEGLRPADTIADVARAQRATAEAARLLLDQMTDFRREERSVLMPVTLSVRESTGPPRQETSR